MLCRDNYRLKEIEKSQKGSSLRTDTFEEKKETINEPYVIKTRSNNLQLINEKNRTNKQSGVVSGTPSRYDDYQNQPGDHLGRKL